MSPKEEHFYHEYFDQAGNQKKFFPGEKWIYRDPEPEDPEEKKIYDIVQSKIKVINDFLEARKHWNNLVADANNASRYGGREGTRGHEIWTRKLQACDAFEPTYKKAEDAAKKVLFAAVRRLFPDFEIDEDPKKSRTSLGYYTKEVNGHVFMIITTRDKEDYWNKKQSIIIRDDGMVFPEFEKIFNSDNERNAAFTKYKEALKNSVQAESTKINENNAIDASKTYDFLIAGVKKSDPSSLKIKLYTRKDFEAFFQSLRDKNAFVEDPDDVWTTVTSIADSDFNSYPDTIAYFETKTAVYNIMPLD